MERGDGGGAAGGAAATVASRREAHLKHLIHIEPDHVQTDYALLGADAHELGARLGRHWAVAGDEEFARVHHVDPRRAVGGDGIGAVARHG